MTKKYLENYGRFDEYDTDEEAYKALMTLEEDKRPEFLDGKDKRVIAHLKQKDSTK